MDKKEIKINVAAENGELIIRQGAALPLKEPNLVRINGTIDAPRVWVGTKEFKADNSHVKVDLEKGSILLIVEENSPYFKSIQGSLDIFPDLEKFTINTKTTYSAKQLAQFLKFNKIYFKDKDKNLDIVAELMQLKGSVVQNFENSDNLKGNKKFLFEQKLQQQYNLDFALSIPLFTNSDPVSFNVEVNYDVTDGDVKFWLESVELKELQDKFKKELIKKEIKEIEKKIKTIIYV